MFSLSCVCELLQKLQYRKLPCKLPVEHFAAGCSGAVYGSFAYFYLFSPIYQSINQYYCNGIPNCVICVVL